MTKTATKHRGARLDVRGIRFVSAECECRNCKGWMWSRHLVTGTRIEPYIFGTMHRAGDSVEAMADWYSLPKWKIRAAIEWYERRSAERRRA